MRSAALALLSAMSLLAGAAAAQTVLPEGGGVAKTKRVSIVDALPKPSSRPRISRNAIEKPPAAKRGASAGSASDVMSRARVSENSEDAAVRRVTTIGSYAQHTPDSAARPPDPDLLGRQTAPDCVLKSEIQGVDEATVRTMKLDYERQCYRQSEFILRARMERLQEAVSRMIEFKAIRSSER
jgi:hypothetical protein